MAVVQLDCLVTLPRLRRPRKPGSLPDARPAREDDGFATWPIVVFNGRFFALVGKYAPPPPQGVSPPVQWGDLTIIREDSDLS